MPVRLPTGLLLAADLETAKTVLNTPDVFDIPHNVSRQRADPDASADRTRTGIDFLDPGTVARGRATFTVELNAALAALAPTDTEAGLDVEVDAMELLRAPVARSTTDALLPDLPTDVRDDVARKALAWVDALGPVISRRRPAGRWSRVRRTEQRTLTDLRHALEPVSDRPAAVATALAAGIQVPIAAGAWVLVMMATNPATTSSAGAPAVDPTAVVWETLRMFPPTWLLPRLTTQATTLGGLDLPAITPIAASPVALGQLPELVPGPEAGFADRTVFDPTRWTAGEKRPGAWLPFGAGPRACPGRNLGMAQLVALAARAAHFDLTSDLTHRIDASRGLRPDPARVRFRAAAGLFRSPEAVR